MQLSGDTGPITMTTTHDQAIEAEIQAKGLTTGESACASPENFDAEIGRKIARQNAVAKVWPLMGYALRERLSAAEARP